MKGKHNPRNHNPEGWTGGSSKKGKHKFTAKKLDDMNIGSQQYGDQLNRLISNGQLSKDIVI